MSKVDEIGASKLSIGSLTPAEQLEQAQKLADILRTMRGVVSDHRTGNVHLQSGSMLPERPTPPTPKAGNGWQDQVPLSPPPGIREMDRGMDVEDAQWRAERAARLKPR
jgi:hypothetical protein